MQKITNKEYHAAPGVSATGFIKLVKGTPAHYKAYVDGKFKQTDSMKFGTACHMAILEPELFKETYIAKPEGLHLGTTEGKAWKKQNENKQFLSWDEYIALEEIYHKVWNHSRSSEYLTGGAAEQSFFFKDEANGMIRKCRPDYLTQVAVVDIKTTSGMAVWDEFKWEIKKYRYDIAAAWYLDVLSAGQSVPDLEFMHIVIEKNPPYGIKFFRSDEAMIENARSVIKKYLPTLRKCLETGKFSGYSEDIESISIPHNMWGEEIDEYL